MNFRKHIFYLKDKLKGGVIYNHIKDIGYINENPNSQISKVKIEYRKSSLLEHAVKNVSFYKNNIVDKKLVNLDSFPIINKNIIRDSINDFITDGVDINSLHKLVTSGSTGTPFSVFQDYKKKDRNTADTIYFGKLAGFNIGVRLNYLKIWTKVNKKNVFKSWLENIEAIDVTQLSDNEIEKLISKFKSNSKSMAFLGYSSALESICRYLDKNEPNFKIKNITGIIAMSESISQSRKTSLFNYFGKHPVSRYSNVENGIIAQQMADGSNVFVVNWASYYVEILEIDKDLPVNYGQVGRIVITDYFNYSMPIIRYDTGDIGTIDWDEQKENLVLSKVEGRKMDMVFNTTGGLVSSFTITNNMWLYPEIRQYQFIQASKSDYLFRLNLSVKFEREAILILEFKKYFGIDANIRVEYVDEIPLLNSGKRKKVINISK